ncbi:MAG TPA: peptide deformylase [Lutibacter sp.]|nr:peptide deformylase [Lutibacter sp.]
MISRIFSLVIIVIFLTSCGTAKKGIKKSNIFSKQETQLILSGKIDEPMRVLLITNPKDSVILRSKSQPFKVGRSNKVLDYFTSRLYHTVRDSATKGVGIAAPQVGILKKIIWIQRFDKENEPFEVYFNPEIKKYSEMKQDVMEGCLSIPNTREMMHNRAYAVFLEYDNNKGEHKCEMIEAFTAVIFQHEIDHLDGILFTDHLEKERKESIKHSIK